MVKKQMFLVICLCLMGVLASSGWAAMITWEEPFGSAVAGDVVATGTLHEAFNCSPDAGEVVANGVTFTNTDDLLPNSATGPRLGGATTGDAGYDALLTTLDWGGGAAVDLTVGGGTLVPGKLYLIQIWMTDLTTPEKMAKLLTIADEFGNEVQIQCGGGELELGQYAVGTGTILSHGWQLSFNRVSDSYGRGFR